MEDDPFELVVDMMAVSAECVKTIRPRKSEWINGCLESVPDYEFFRLDVTRSF